MKKIKLTKEESVILIAITLFSIIMCNAFLKMHYSSDTFCLMYRGYFDYPKYYFLLDARIVSTIVCYMGGILHLPYNIYIVTLDFIGVILLSLSVFLLYKLIIKQLNIKKLINKIAILIASYVIIFNHISIEYILYPESGVMCLGIFLVIIATNKYFTEKKHKNLKTFGIMLLATLCYQGIINLFPVLTVTIMFLKKRNVMNIKYTIKNYVLDIVKIGNMFMISMLMSYSITKIADRIIGNTSSRLRTGKTIENILKALRGIFHEQFFLMPDYLGVIVFLITLLILILYSKNKIKCFQYLIVVFTAYTFTLLPILAWGYIAARMAIGIGSIMGISLLFISSLLYENINNKAKKIIICLILIYFVVNSINFMNNARQHISANKIDENMGHTISAMLNKYEQETGNTITKFQYRYDKKSTTYGKGIIKATSLTERKFKVEWCITEAVSYYCDRYFEKEIIMSDEIYDKYFNGNETNVFTEDNIVFDGDTMYMYVY